MFHIIDDAIYFFTNHFSEIFWFIFEDKIGKGKEKEFSQ